MGNQGSTPANVTPGPVTNAFTTVGGAIDTGIRDISNLFSGRLGTTTNLPNTGVNNQVFIETYRNLDNQLNSILSSSDAFRTKFQNVQSALNRIRTNLPQATITPQINDQTGALSLVISDPTNGLTYNYQAAPLSPGNLNFRSASNLIDNRTNSALFNNSHDPSIPTTAAGANTFTAGTVTGFVTNPFANQNQQPIDQSFFTNLDFRLDSIFSNNDIGWNKRLLTDDLLNRMRGIVPGVPIMFDFDDQRGATVYSSVPGGFTFTFRATPLTNGPGPWRTESTLIETSTNRLISSRTPTNGSVNNQPFSLTLNNPGQSFSNNDFLATAVSKNMPYPDTRYSTQSRVITTFDPKAYIKRKQQY